MKAWQAALRSVTHLQRPAWKGGGDVGACGSELGQRGDLMLINCVRCVAEVQNLLKGLESPRPMNITAPDPVESKPT